MRASNWCGSGTETGLGSCYQQIPVRLMPPFSFDAEPAALLYLINLTAGLMDGDAHLIELTARAGSCAVVTGQSATRVHPALASFATQHWAVSVEDDACLVVLPGPTIPYRGCRYFQPRSGRTRPDRAGAVGRHLAAQAASTIERGNCRSGSSSSGSCRTSRCGRRGT